MKTVREALDELCPEPEQEKFKNRMEAVEAKMTEIGKAAGITQAATADEADEIMYGYKLSKVQELGLKTAFHLFASTLTAIEAFVDLFTPEKKEE